MAFTRKFLSALGIEADKVDEIMSAHNEVTDGLKAERDQYKAKAEKLPEVQKQLDKANKDLESAQNDDYKGKYESEKAAHDKLKADIASKETVAKKEAAVKVVLKEEGFSEKGIAKILKYDRSIVDDVELDENGKIKEADKLKTNVAAEWSEYKAQSHVEGVRLDSPPKNVGGDSGKKESEAAKIAAQYHNSIYGETKKEV